MKNKFTEVQIGLPTVIIEDKNEVELRMKPSFDVLWQAAGWEESPMYVGRIEDWKQRGLLL